MGQVALARYRRCPARTYANNNRYPWTPSHNRWPVIEAPTGITFVAYENPPGVTTNEQRVRSFLDSDRGLVRPRQRHRSRPRRAFHPVGAPRRVGRRPTAYVPRTMLMCDAVAWRHGCLVAAARSHRAGERA